jgi:hypothetical protein
MEPEWKIVERFVFLAFRKIRERVQILHFLYYTIVSFGFNPLGW